MSLFYQHPINAITKLGIWKIEEPEGFFLKKVPLQREITHPHKRLQHLAGRYLLQYLFPDFPYEEILIADTRKPYLPYEQYHFSISHCGDYAAAIVSSEQRVGIDIEMVSERVSKISHKFLHTTESDFIRKQSNEHDSHPDHQTTRQLTVAWSAKEAVFKWWGWGGIDFSEHILLEPFSPGNNGLINTVFLRESEVFPLQLQYKIFHALCLVWLASDP